MNSIASLNTRRTNAERALYNARVSLFESDTDTPTDILVRKVNDILVRETEWVVFREAAVLAAAGADMQKWAIDKLSVGADDTWSGRGNDQRRLVFDATRETVKNVLFSVSLK